MYVVFGVVALLVVAGIVYGVYCPNARTSGTDISSVRSNARVPAPVSKRTASAGPTSGNLGTQDESSQSSTAAVRIPKAQQDMINMLSKMKRILTASQLNAHVINTSAAHTIIEAFFTDELMSDTVFKNLWEEFQKESKRVMALR
eukprot:984486_1